MPAHVFLLHRNVLLDQNKKKYFVRLPVTPVIKSQNGKSLSLTRVGPESWQWLLYTNSLKTGPYQKHFCFHDHASAVTVFSIGLVGLLSYLNI